MVQEKQKIKLMSLFSGYDGGAWALKKANIPFEFVGISEIDKFAIQIHKQNWGYIKNFGDCTKINVDEVPDFDLLTAGFVCTSFSTAGKQLGEDDPRGVGKLFYEIIRICEVKKPKWLVLENVEGLTQEKFKDTFRKILEELSRIGYNVRYELLNTKNYGIPQNRNRIIFVCYRKDLEFNFEFPKKEELNLFLKDILEKEVDKKYYLNENQLNRLIRHNSKIDEYIVKCITASDNMKMSKRMNFTDVSNLESEITIGDFRYDEGFRVRKDGNSPTLCSTMGGNSMSGGMPIIIQKVGDRGKNSYSIKKEYSNTIPSNPMSDRQQFLIENKTIRRLTPRECFRLQGFINDEINFGDLSDSQLYKLCGNGWSINVFEKVFKEMFIYKRNESLLKW